VKPRHGFFHSVTLRHTLLSVDGRTRTVPLERPGRFLAWLEKRVLARVGTAGATTLFVSSDTEKETGT